MANKQHIKAAGQDLSCQQKEVSSLPFEFYSVWRCQGSRSYIDKIHIYTYIGLYCWSLWRNVILVIWCASQEIEVRLEKSSTLMSLVSCYVVCRYIQFDRTGWVICCITDWAMGSYLTKIFEENNSMCAFQYDDICTKSNSLWWQPKLGERRSVATIVCNMFGYSEKCNVFEFT